MTIETKTVSVSDLKKVKNSVIGNPLAKDGVVRDEGLMRTLIDSIGDSANLVPEEIKIEAAHILASLSYGSEIALSALLKLNTPYLFVFALSKLSPDGSISLRAAYARALRALVSSIADVVGPSEYGLRPEAPSSLRLETKEALDGMFTFDTLDTILPLLLSPSQQIVTPVVQLIGSATRSSVHRSILVSWLPPDERRKEQGKAKKRGWEKLSSSSSASPISPGASTSATAAASWIVKVLIMLLARVNNSDVKTQEAVLLAMAALAKENGPVAVGLGRGLGLGPDAHGVSPLALVLNYTKSRNADVQLAACLCATHIIRGVSSTHLPPPSSSNPHTSVTYAQSLYATIPLDDACIRAVINMVNRVVGAEGLGDVERRVKACFVLYHLTTDDKPLCHFAFERGCLDVLAGLVKSITPADPVPVPPQAAQEGGLAAASAALAWRWDESESEGVTRLREAALTAIATLALFSDPVRRAITGTHALLPYISTALKQGLPPSALASPSTSNSNSTTTTAAPSNSTPTKRSFAATSTSASTSSSTLTSARSLRGRRTDHTPGVRYAACQCVRVLARGVAVLRTNIVDSGLGMEVFRIVVRGAKSKAANAASPSHSRGDESIEGREGDEAMGEGEEEDEEEDRRVLNAALAAVCNIVMEFSPLRPIYLEQGLMPRLVQLLLHSGDSAIRMNALWAIKNLLYKSSTETKRDVMRELGWPRVFELLHDPDLGIQEQAYHVVRNLSETEDGIEMVFRELGVDAILDSITEAISLDNGMMLTTPVSPTSPSTTTASSTTGSATSSAYPPPPVPRPLQDRTPTILQAISTLANLCNGPHVYTSQILAKPQLLTNLKTCLAECGAEIRKVGVSCVLTLVQEHPKKRRVFVDVGVVGTLRRLCEWVPPAAASGSSLHPHAHHHHHHHHNPVSSHHHHPAGSSTGASTPTPAASASGPGITMLPSASAPSLTGASPVTYHVHAHGPGYAHPHYHHGVGVGGWSGHHSGGAAGLSVPGSISILGSMAYPSGSHHPSTVHPPPSSTSGSAAGASAGVGSSPARRASISTTRTAVPTSPVRTMPAGGGPMTTASSSSALTGQPQLAQTTVPTVPVTTGGSLYSYRPTGIDYQGEDYPTGGSSSSTPSTNASTTNTTRTGPPLASSVNPSMLMYANDYHPLSGLFPPHGHHLHPHNLHAVHQYHPYNAVGSSSAGYAGVAGGSGAGVGSGSGFGHGHGVHPALDMDKEVYERARMALDWLEHGDGYGM